MKGEVNMKKFLAFLVVAMSICASALAAPSKDEAYTSFNKVRNEVMAPITATYSDKAEDNCIISLVKSTDKTRPDKYYKTIYFKPVSYVSVKDTGEATKPYYGVLEIQRVSKDYPKRLTSAVAAKQDAVVETNTLKYKMHYEYVDGAWNLVKTDALLNNSGSKWETITLTGAAKDVLSFHKPVVETKMVKVVTVKK